MSATAKAKVAGTSYANLKKKGAIRRGRPRLSDEERTERKKMVLMRSEARRRAMLALKAAHSDEFEQLTKLELETILRESRKNK
jgi:hypothetical protein